MATPCPKTPDGDADAGSRQGTADKVVLLNPEESLMQYGPKTLATLHQAIKSTYKIFWDGSISLF
jgi:3-phosphoglycerate kinase